MGNVTVDSLKKLHGDEAGPKFQEIATLGGFGNVPANYEGGLDIASALSDDNKAVSAAHKAKIAELAGIELPAAKKFDKGASK